ncbi:MFS transporter [Trinickia fusca]|uniref:MFS transporter n=1 Tax=Trinickia fusca TaxID=2419777 RepID=A0A494XJC6_9BURK|nr:MFS transporter [Trinickia fusca]RKP48229.1 MFS transporter [Trinickia fusca]
MKVAADLSPARHGDDVRNRWYALVVVVTAMFMALVDVFIVNIALPSIQIAFGATSEQLEWAVASYTLCYALFLIMGGRAGDHYGRKKVFLAGMLLFSIFSLACGLASSVGMLIAARAFQGVGAALMVPQVFATIQTSFDDREKPKALAIYGATVGLASILGQVLGALLMGHGRGGPEWRMLFLINVPIGIAAIAAGLVVLPVAKTNSKVGFDVGGAALLTIALVALFYPIAGLASGHVDVWKLAVPLALFPIVGALFLWHERRRVRALRNALLHPKLLTQRRFTAGLWVVFALQAALAGFLFVLTLFFQNGLGMSPSRFGLVLIAPGLGYGIASLLAPAALRKFGIRLMIVCSGLTGVGYLWLAVLPQLGGEAGSLIRVSIAPMFLIGFATGIIFTPTVGRAIGTLEPHLVGAASGVLPTVIQLANLVGVIGIGTLYFRMSTVLPDARATYSAACVLIAVLSAACTFGIAKEETAGSRP